MEPIEGGRKKKKKNNPYYKLLDWREAGPIDDTYDERFVRQAVLLHHGIDMSADSWFFKNDPDDTGLPVPIALYEAGYDVWLANNRGVSHS